MVSGPAEDSKRYHCPHCQSRLRIKSRYFGQTVDCPACRGSFFVEPPREELTIAAQTLFVPAPRLQRVKQLLRRTKEECTPRRILAGGIVLTCLIVWSWLPSSHSSNPADSQIDQAQVEQAADELLADLEQAEQQRIRDDARRVAKLWVKKDLKSPATAKFIEPIEVTKLAGDGDDLEIGYRAEGQVDSQNSFGALIRSDWIVGMTYLKGEEKWDCRHVTIDGEFTYQNPELRQAMQETMAVLRRSKNPPSQWSRRFEFSGIGYKAAETDIERTRTFRITTEQWRFGWDVQEYPHFEVFQIQPNGQSKFIASAFAPEENPRRIIAGPGQYYIEVTTPAVWKLWVEEGVE